MEIWGKMLTKLHRVHGKVWAHKLTSYDVNRLHAAFNTWTAEVSFEA